MAARASPFRRILVAVDGSEPAFRAAEMAASIARVTGAPLAAVAVVHVAPPVYSAGAFVPGAAFDYTRELREHLTVEARKALSRVAESARRQRVEARTQILEGHVPSQILKFAGKGKFDLLVVGSRGFGGVKRLFLGSVSTALVHEAKMSVLVVR